jgi:hypothetical protein
MRSMIEVKTLILLNKNDVLGVETVPAERQAAQPLSAIGKAGRRWRGKRFEMSNGAC